MELINNDKAKELLANEIYDCSLNIMYENPMTKNYYIDDDDIKLMMRFTIDSGIITLAVVIFSFYNQNYMKYISNIIDYEYKDTNRQLTVQLYSDNMLVNVFKELYFEVKLILRDHIRVEDRFYTIISLSKGGVGDVGGFKCQEIV